MKYFAPLVVPAVNSVMAAPKQYKVKAPNGKTTVVFAGGRTMFGSYEEARRAVRKLLRRKVVQGKINKHNFDAYRLIGMWDDISRNPTKLAGYKIVAV